MFAAQHAHGSCTMECMSFGRRALHSESEKPQGCVHLRGAHGLFSDLSGK